MVHDTAGDPMTGFDLAIQQVDASWRYNPTTGSYLRSQDGGPHKLTDGKQVSTENVIVAWLDYRNPTSGVKPGGDKCEG